MPLRIKVSATKRFKPEQMFAVLQEASNAALFATQESIREVAPVDKGLLASPAHWKTRVEQAAGTLRTLLTTQLHYATGTDAPYSTRGTEARFPIAGATPVCLLPLRWVRTTALHPCRLRAGKAESR